jgi:hypothetical protein
LLRSSAKKKREKEVKEIPYLINSFSNIAYAQSGNSKPHLTTDLRNGSVTHCFHHVQTLEAFPSPYQDIPASCPSKLCTRFPQIASQILAFRAFLRKRAKTPILQRDDLLSDAFFFTLMVVPVTKAFIWRDAYIPPTPCYISLLIFNRYFNEMYKRDLEFSAGLDPTVLEKKFRFHSFWYREFRSSLEREQSMQRDWGGVDQARGELGI